MVALNFKRDFVAEIDEGRKRRTIRRIRKLGKAKIKADARLSAAAPDMLAALKSACEQCSNCDGRGNAFLMEDETLYGQAPGSSRANCVICAPWRAAIAKAEP